MIERGGSPNASQQLDLPGRPTRGAQIISLVDRVRNDPVFRSRYAHAPEETAAQMGLRLSAAEWAGLRGLLDR
jgi:hypothetical protein